MKATAKAHANIAFIKYWGKIDEELRLPANSSFSMNIDKCFTITTIEFSKKYKKDSFEIVGEKISSQDEQRVFKHLNRLRKKAHSSLFAKVVSKNSFPKSTGVAASASGFAALTVAASNALDFKLNEKELSILARLGSGSACRSIPSGFVEWREGKTSEQSYAYSLYPETYWDLRDILLVVSAQEKAVSSTAGQKEARQSIFYQQRVDQAQKLLPRIKQALKQKDFAAFGEIMEKDCLAMHSVMMTSNPPLFYWMPKTVEIIRSVYQWRNEGLPVYFTIDAGPNVHLICQAEKEKAVLEKIKKIKWIKRVIVNKPAKGAHLINSHLF